MPDTPTLSPAARERVEKAMRELERAAFDPFMPYNPDPARAALTATVAALVAEAEARGREAGATSDGPLTGDPMHPLVSGAAVTPRHHSECQVITRGGAQCDCGGLYFAARRAGLAWPKPERIRDTPTPTPHAPHCLTRSSHPYAEALHCTCGATARPHAPEGQ